MKLRLLNSLFPNPISYKLENYRFCNFLRQHGKLNIDQIFRALDTPGGRLGGIPVFSQSRLPNANPSVTEFQRFWKYLSFSHHESTINSDLSQQ